MSTPKKRVRKAPVMTPKLAKARLLRLADFLDKLPAERFDFSTWAGNDDKPWRGKQNLSCGTVACALGWAATFPYAQKLGVRLLRIPNDSAGVLGVNGSGGYEAVAKTLFGLSHDDAWELFMSGDKDSGMRLTSSSSKGVVAANIRAYVARTFG